MKTSVNKRKNKNSNKLSFVPAKANKGFTIGLFFLFLTGSILIVMTSLIPESVQASFDNYLKQYNVSEGSIVTDVVNSKDYDLSNIDGIKNYETNFIFDTNIRTNSGLLKQMRTFSVESQSVRKFHFYETSDYDYYEPHIWLTRHFAEAADVHAGDSIDIKNGDKYESIKISAVVSTPDSVYCSYDETFWCEDDDFGYVFVPREVVDAAFGASGKANLFTVVFNDNTTVQQKKLAIDTACERLGTNVKSSQVFEESKSKRSLDDNLAALSSTCSIFPSVILTILLICSMLFLHQIINNQRKYIGLLMALGYTKRRIVNYYLNYLIAIVLGAIVIGSIIAYFFSLYILSTYQASYDIPYMLVKLSPRCYLMLGLMLLTAIISCVWSARGITKIDPSEAYETVYVVSEPYKFKLPIFNNINSITKFCLARIFSKKMRTVATSLSISACMILTFCSIAAYLSKIEAINYTFNDRYNYDYFVSFEDNDSFVTQLQNIEGIEKVEPVTVILDSVKNNDIDFDLQVHALNGGADLIHIHNKDMKEIKPTDGVIMDEYFLEILNKKVGDSIPICGKDVKIENSAREYLNAIQYISPDLAKSLGYSSPNACAFTTNKNLSDNEVLQKVSDISGFGHLKIKDHQKVNKLNSQLTLDLVFYALVFLAIFIGLIIIFNMIVIIVNERRFEYSTLIALGVEKFRFRKNIFLENFILYFIALIIAIVPSYYLANFILSSMNGTVQEFPFVHGSIAYIATITISIVYILAGIFYTMRRIGSFNPAIELNLRG